RAEYRLLLRQDNADLRLSEIGFGVGLLSREKYETVCRKRDAIAQEIHRLERQRIGPDTLAQILRRPEVVYRDLPSGPALDDEIAHQEIEVKRLGAFEARAIPAQFDYYAVIGLRHETREKLQSLRPGTVGQA